MKTKPTLLALSLFVFLCPLAACKKTMSEQEAAALVRRYNERVIEAFRTGDPMLVTKVAGPKEQSKLTGLIGSKSDMGYNLDAQMTEFKVLNVFPGKDQVTVFTEERWYYRDRQIGTGRQMGQDSKDHYYMTYILRRPEGLWVVDEIRFTGPPEVGRTEANVKAPASVLHGQGILSEAGVEAAQTGKPPHGTRAPSKGREP